MALYEIEAGCYYSWAIGVDQWLGIRIDRTPPGVMLRADVRFWPIAAVH